MKSFRLSSLVLATSLLTFIGCNAPKPEPTPAPKPTPAAPASEPPSITPPANEPRHTWTTEQILTCTVSQCWQLANRDEETFFDIVQELAAISAKNRDLTLPEDEDAGRKAGEHIKARARENRDELLYAIVDEAVRQVGASGATPAR